MALNLNWLPNNYKAEIKKYRPTLERISKLPFKTAFAEYNKKQPGQLKKAMGEYLSRADPTKWKSWSGVEFGPLRTMAPKPKKTGGKKKKGANWSKIADRFRAADPEFDKATETYSDKMVVLLGRFTKLLSSARADRDEGDADPGLLLGKYLIKKYPGKWQEGAASEKIGELEQSITDKDEEIADAKLDVEKWKGDYDTKKADYDKSLLDLQAKEAERATAQRLYDAEVIDHKKVSDAKKLVDDQIIACNEKKAELQKSADLSESRQTALEKLTTEKATLQTNYDAALGQLVTQEELKEAQDELKLDTAALDTREAGLDTRETGLDTRGEAQESRKSYLDSQRTQIDDTRTGLHDSLKTHHDRIRDAVGENKRPLSEAFKNKVKNYQHNQIQFQDKNRDYLQEKARLDGLPPGTVTPEQRSALSLQKADLDSTRRALDAEGREVAQLRLNEVKLDRKHLTDTYNATSSAQDQRKIEQDARKAGLDLRKTGLDTRKTTLDTRQTGLDTRKATLDTRQTEGDLEYAKTAFSTQPLQNIRDWLEGNKNGAPGFDKFTIKRGDRTINLPAADAKAEARKLGAEPASNFDDLSRKFSRESHWWKRRVLKTVFAPTFPEGKLYWGLNKYELLKAARSDRAAAETTPFYFDPANQDLEVDPARKVASDRAALQTDRTKLGQDQAALDTRSGNLDTRETGLETRKATLDTRSGELDTRHMTQEQRAEYLDKQRAQVDATRGGVENTLDTFHSRIRDAAGENQRPLSQQYKNLVKELQKAQIEYTDQERDYREDKADYDLLSPTEKAASTGIKATLDATKAKLLQERKALDGLKTQVAQARLDEVKLDRQHLTQSYQTQASELESSKAAHQQTTQDWAQSKARQEEMLGNRKTALEKHKTRLETREGELDTRHMTQEQRAEHLDKQRSQISTGRSGLHDNMEAFHTGLRETAGEHARPPSKEFQEKVAAYQLNQKDYRKQKADYEQEKQRIDSLPPGDVTAEQKENLKGLKSKVDAKRQALDAESRQITIARLSEIDKDRRHILDRVGTLTNEERARNRGRDGIFGDWSPYPVRDAVYGRGDKTLSRDHLYDDPVYGKNSPYENLDPLQKERTGMSNIQGDAPAADFNQSKGRPWLPGEKESGLDIPNIKTPDNWESSLNGTAWLVFWQDPAKAIEYLLNPDHPKRYKRVVRNVLGVKGYQEGIAYTPSLANDPTYGTSDWTPTPGYRYGGGATTTQPQQKTNSQKLLDDLNKSLTTKTPTADREYAKRAFRAQSDNVIRRFLDGNDGVFEFDHGGSKVRIRAGDARKIAKQMGVPSTTERNRQINRFGNSSDKKKLQILNEAFDHTGSDTFRWNGLTKADLQQAAEDHNFYYDPNNRNLRTRPPGAETNVGGGQSNVGGGASAGGEQTTTSGPTLIFPTDEEEEEEEEEVVSDLDFAKNAFRNLPAKTVQDFLDAHERGIGGYDTYEFRRDGRTISLSADDAKVVAGERGLTSTTSLQSVLTSFQNSPDDWKLSWLKWMYHKDQPEDIRKWGATREELKAAAERGGFYFDPANPDVRTDPKVTKAKEDFRKKSPTEQRSLLKSLHTKPAGSKLAGLTKDQMLESARAGGMYFDPANPDATSDPRLAPPTDQGSGETTSQPTISQPTISQPAVDPNQHPTQNRPYLPGEKQYGSSFPNLSPLKPAANWKDNLSDRDKQIAELDPSILFQMLDNPEFTAKQPLIRNILRYKTYDTGVGADASRASDANYGAGTPETYVSIRPPVQETTTETEEETTDDPVVDQATLLNEAKEAFRRRPQWVQRAHLKVAFSSGKPDDYKFDGLTKAQMLDIARAGGMYFNPANPDVRDDPSKQQLGSDSSSAGGGGESDAYIQAAETFNGRSDALKRALINGFGNKPADHKTQGLTKAQMIELATAGGMYYDPDNPSATSAPTSQQGGSAGGDSAGGGVTDPDPVITDPVPGTGGQDSTQTLAEKYPLDSSLDDPTWAKNRFMRLTPEQKRMYYRNGVMWLSRDGVDVKLQATKMQEAEQADGGDLTQPAPKRKAPPSSGVGDDLLKRINDLETRLAAKGISTGDPDTRQRLRDLEQARINNLETRLAAKGTSTGDADTRQRLRDLEQSRIKNLEDQIRYRDEQTRRAEEERRRNEEEARRERERLEARSSEPIGEDPDDKFWAEVRKLQLRQKEDEEEAKKFEEQSSAMFELKTQLDELDRFTSSLNLTGDEAFPGAATVPQQKKFEGLMDRYLENRDQYIKSLEGGLETPTQLLSKQNRYSIPTGGGKRQISISQSREDPMLLLKKLQAMNHALAVGQLPYQRYPGPITPKLDAAQKQAVQMMTDNHGQWMTALAPAASLTGEAAQEAALEGTTKQARIPLIKEPGWLDDIRAPNYPDNVPAMRAADQAVAAQAQMDPNAYLMKQGVGDLDQKIAYDSKGMDAAQSLKTLSDQTLFDRYQNPYTRDVVETTMARLRTQQQEEMRGIDQQFISAGAYGSTRHAVSRQAAAAENKRVLAEMEAKLKSQAYDRGMTHLEADVGRQQEASALGARLETATRTQRAAQNLDRSKSREQILTERGSRDLGIRKEIAISDAERAQQAAEANEKRRQEARLTNYQANQDIRGRVYQTEADMEKERQAAKLQRARYNQSAAIKGIQEKRLAAQQLTNMAKVRGNQSRQDIEMVSKLGDMRRNVSQEQYDAWRSEWDKAQDYPFRRSKFLSDAMGIPQSSASTYTDSPSTKRKRSTWDKIKDGVGVASSIFGLIANCDERMKEDITPLGKDTITGLPMYSFRYKGDPKSYPKVVGPMAQDIEKIAPDMVKTIGSKGYKAVNLGIMRRGK